MLMHIFGVGVGMTFSGGLIDMTLFGIMQGNAKTHWLYIVLVGIVYFFVYWGFLQVPMGQITVSTLVTVRIGSNKHCLSETDIWAV